MTTNASISRVVIQILFVSLFLVVLTGCSLWKSSQNDCGASNSPDLVAGGKPPDPVSCPNNAIPVTQNNSPPGCMAVAGSKKCSATNLPCPLARGPKTCKTVVGPGGVCSCKCP